MNGKERAKACGRCFVPVITNFFITVLLTTGIISLSVWIAIRFPQSPDWSGVTFDYSYKPPYLPMDPAYNNYTVLLDAHSHTNFSDGDLTPKQNIEWHIANGFNAMVLTDHNNIDGAIETQRIARALYDDKIKVILGVEYSCCRIHMNLVGVNKSFDGTAWPTDEELQQVINETHAQGGLVIVNHIPWSLNYNRLQDHPTLEQLLQWGVDYVGVVNGDTFDYQGYRFAQQNGMGAITATDMHSNGDVNGWTAMMPSNFTEEAILEALLAKNTSLIYSAVNSPYSRNPKTITNFWTPWNTLGIFVIQTFQTTFEPMWSFRHSFCGKTSIILHWNIVWMFVGWALIIFASVELLSFLVGKLKERIFRKKRTNNKSKAYRSSDRIPLSSTNHSSSDEEGDVWDK